MIDAKQILYLTKQARAINDSLQLKTKTTSTEWHKHKTINDKLADILTLTEDNISSDVVYTSTRTTLRNGEKYNFIGQTERMIYLGKKWYGSGFWHQFAKVEAPSKVWSELQERDLHLIENTKPDKNKLCTETHTTKRNSCAKDSDPLMDETLIDRVTMAIEAEVEMGVSIGSVTLLEEIRRVLTGVKDLLNTVDNLQVKTKEVHAKDGITKYKLDLAAWAAARSAAAQYEKDGLNVALSTRGLKQAVNAWRLEFKYRETLATKPTAKEIRLLTLAIKHCPITHSDITELSKIFDEVRAKED